VLAGFRRVAVGQLLGRLKVHQDTREALRDGVVHLARNALAFLEHGRLNARVFECALRLAQRDADVVRDIGVRSPTDKPTSLCVTQSRTRPAKFDSLLMAVSSCSYCHACRARSRRNRPTR
jgi:hypothetical protein